MMRAILTVLGVLIGPVAGFFGMYLSELAVPDGECGVVAGPLAFVRSVFIGVPVGAVTFGVIGLWLGSRLDKKAKHQHLDGKDDS